MLKLAYQVAYPIAYNETNITEAAAEISSLWSEIGEVEAELLAACRHCGQVQNLAAVPFAYGVDNTESATRRCNCPAAKIYMNDLMRQEHKKSDRIAALENAAEVIDEMLEDGAVGFGPVAIKEGVRDMLINAATLVYDCKLTSASLNISEWITVKITRSAKGKLTIQRNDKAVSKQELNS